MLSWRQREGLDHFVGKDRSYLVKALGKPSREWADKGSGYLSYVYDANVWMPGEWGMYTPGGAVDEASWVDHRTCTTIFQLNVEKVSAWSLDGRSCRDAPYPPVKKFAADKLASAAGQSIGKGSSFSYEPATYSSAVEYDTYYSK